LRKIQLERSSVWKRRAPEEVVFSLRKQKRKVHGRGHNSTSSRQKNRQENECFATGGPKEDVQQWEKTKSVPNRKRKSHEEEKIGIEGA